MDDRNPAKLLLCARDVLVGLVLPWHLGADHNDRITTLRNAIEDAVNSKVNDNILIKLMENCMTLIEELIIDAHDVHRVYARFDRARLTFMCLHKSLVEMITKEI